MSPWFEDTNEYRRMLAEERLAVAATELTSEALRRRGRTRTWLAERLGVRLPEISQRLSGRRNLTLRSLAGMFHELDYDVELRLADQQSTSVDVYRESEGACAREPQPEATAAPAPQDGRREGLDELLASWDAETAIPEGLQRQVAAELDKAGLARPAKGGGQAAT